MGYDIRPEGRGRAVAYRSNESDALEFARRRAVADSRVMVIVDVATNRAQQLVQADGSVSLAPDGYRG